MSTSRLRTNYYDNRKKFDKKRKQNSKKSIVIMLLVVAIFLFFTNKPTNLTTKYSKFIETEAKANSIDPLLVSAIIKQESGFDEQAVSTAGAVGLMQLMPNTAKWMCNKEGLDYSERLLLDPEFNIMLGCRYLSFLMDYWDSSLPEVIASYNAGQSNVKAWLASGTWDGTSKNLNQIPFPETRKYVEKVLSNYEKLKKTGSS